MKDLHSLIGSEGDYSLHLNAKDWQNNEGKIVSGKYYKVGDASYNNVRYRKSSGGLSGGAIAGIVIACFVVIAAASIAAIMLRKPSRSNEDTTVVGLKTIEDV